MRKEQERTVSHGAETEGGCEIPTPLITATLPCSEDYFLFLEIQVGHRSHQQQLAEESRG